MTPEERTAHLRECARLSESAWREGNSLDYSPEALTARLREASDLLNLCLQLGASMEPVDDHDRIPLDVASS